MNPSQIALFQHSFLQLVPDADKLTDLFYARLFQLEPKLRGMFPNDLHAQKGKLMRALAFAAKSLEFPEEWRAFAEQLGTRHARYGLEMRHYEIFGQALLWTLETGLGEDFTPELRDAWRVFYDELATQMQNVRDLTSLPHASLAPNFTAAQHLPKR